MKRIFAVIMALMMIFSTTSQAFVVTVYGQNCTYTMTSPENREIILNDTDGNVRWWKVEDASNNIIGVINDEFVTPSSNVTVTPMTEGNQIVVQQTANGTIKYSGNVVNTVETTENQSYTLVITPNIGYEIANVKVDDAKLSESQITTSGMDYTFNDVNANHVITATFQKKELIYADTSGANRPILEEGLTPVNWNGTGWVDANISGTWDYDYNSVAETTSNGTVAGNGNGKWANAQTADGSLYVWIPRYTYRITEENGNHQDVDSWNADEGDNKKGKIEIKFSNGTTDDNTDSFLSHPGFTLGNDELEGIWVAKYEASMENGSGTNVETIRDTAGNLPLSDDVKLASKPSAFTWRFISVSQAFENAYNLNRDLDSHLMKNVEWGAVAYLTNAIGRIPYINNYYVDEKLKTGYSGKEQDSAQATTSTSDTYAWNTTNGVKASTTHNVYGIYDMSGGANEYVAAYYTEGYSEYLANDTIKEYAGSLYAAASDPEKEKYVEAYNALNTSNNLGDAIYETGNWDKDPRWSPGAGTPAFLRGGSYNSNSNAGIFFLDSARGNGFALVGFRPVLAVKSNNGGTATTTYTVTFNANGGNGTMNSQTFTRRTAQKLFANTFTRPGYIFAGWTTTAGGTTVNYTNRASYIATGNTTLYAVWEVFIEPNADTSGANAPVIANGLTPVNWNGSYWEETTTSNWKYNYNSVATATQAKVEGNGDSAWANAQTADGSLYVWIPRYTYRITEENGYHQGVDSWNADEGDNKKGKIEIIFSTGTTDTVTSTTGLSKDGYIKHPAFTFGDDELEGIWVAKYEASMEDGSGAHVETSSSTIGNVVLSDSVKLVSKPGVSSWRNISLSNMFDNAYNLNRDLDSHLMKNVEWGAVAYLTNAIGRIPYINNSSDYITGNAGGSQDADQVANGFPTYEWDTANGVKASTTHNVYGIYDMSGGAYEYVAAYYTEGEKEYLSEDTTKSYAGSLYTAANNTETAKYVDKYSMLYSSSNLGDAVYETSANNGASTSWDKEGTWTGSSVNPVIRRSGSHNSKAYAGVFCIDAGRGLSETFTGFRPVLAVKSNNGGAATTYTVTFNANGGDGTMNSQTFTEGTAQNLSANTFTKTGYTFAGWTTTAGGTTVNYINQASYIATGNTTLYAVWESSIGTPNAPVIANGLTPVKWNGSTWETTTTENWDYDYNSVAETTSNGTVAGNGNGKWANAQTADGSMYVWIPRYTYKITSGNHQDVDSWNADEGDNKTGKIEIKFSNGTTDNNTDSYLSHPAFTFGDDELKGIWVAKYEASMEDGSGNHVETRVGEGQVAIGDNVKLVSKPGVSSWRYITVSQAFENAYNLNRDLDSHLMKNVEWGAVAYLTNAIGRIPYINNSGILGTESNYITGNAGGSQDASNSESTPTYGWSTPNGVKASTTHNVYGIYDLSGGSWEDVAAYYAGGDRDYLEYATDKECAESLYTAANNPATAKYVDIYTELDSNGFTYSESKKGDAVYETSCVEIDEDVLKSWDGDGSYAPDYNGPVFTRGGHCFHRSNAGVFCFYGYDGNGSGQHTFRPVLAIQE